jgi:hypothetical protein
MDCAAICKAVSQIVGNSSAGGGDIELQCVSSNPLKTCEDTCDIISGECVSSSSHINICKGIFLIVALLFIS